MILEALVPWNRHTPKEEMKTVQPGDLVNARDPIAKGIIKQGWARQVR